MLITENFQNTINPIVHHWFDLGASRRPSILSQLFNVQRSERNYEEVVGLGTISPAVWDTYEGSGAAGNSGRIGEADFTEDYKTTYTHKEYPMYIALERKLFEDAQVNMAQRIVTRAGDSATNKRETDAASVFNNAFSSSFLGADAVALCSDSHPSGKFNSTTQDNNFALTLTAANVRTVREAMVQFKDDKGNVNGIVPDTLLVPTGLWEDAMQIAKSVNDPTSANNTANINFGMWNVIPWAYLTDTNAWFMIDSKAMRMSLDWFERVPYELKPEPSRNSIVTFVWGAYMRYSFGWSDWRWVSGSNPS